MSSSTKVNRQFANEKFHYNNDYLSNEFDSFFEVTKDCENWADFNGFSEKQTRDTRDAKTNVLLKNSNLTSGDYTSPSRTNKNECSSSLALLAQNYCETKSPENACEQFFVQPVEDPFKLIVGTTKNGDSDKENEVFDFSPANLYFTENALKSQSDSTSCFDNELLEEDLSQLLSDLSLNLPRTFENNNSSNCSDILLSDLSTSSTSEDSSTSEVTNGEFFSESKLEIKNLQNLNVENFSPSTEAELLEVENCLLSNEVDLSVLKKEDLINNVSKPAVSSDFVVPWDFAGARCNHTHVIHEKKVDKSLVKTKQSLFSKVLKCQPKFSKPFVIAKQPETLKQFLQDINYFQYFSFDTPSPDDEIEEKQKLAFEE